MDFESPYNKSDIIYEIIDIDLFLNNFKKICESLISKLETLKIYKRFNKTKYTNEFFLNFIKISEIKTTINMYLNKADNNNYLVSNQLYNHVVREHITYVYFKIINILIDDGYLDLKFDSKKEEFIFPPKPKKRKKK